MGKQLYYEQFTDKKEWVIYPQLSRGMYLVELDGTDTRITRKLMVQ
ncbi:MAG: T9SS type A sorting domain-containing protein [Bacteroidia bacterium]